MPGVEDEAVSAMDAYREAARSARVEHPAFTHAGRPRFASGGESPDSAMSTELPTMIAGLGSGGPARAVCDGDSRERGAYLRAAALRFRFAAGFAFSRFSMNASLSAGPRNGVSQMWLIWGSIPAIWSFAPARACR